MPAGLWHYLVIWVIGWVIGFLITRTLIEHFDSIPIPEVLGERGVKIAGGIITGFGLLVGLLVNPQVREAVFAFDNFLTNEYLPAEKRNADDYTNISERAERGY